MVRQFNSYATYDAASTRKKMKLCMRYCYSKSTQLPTSLLHINFLHKARNFRTFQNKYNGKIIMVLLTFLNFFMLGFYE